MDDGNSGVFTQVDSALVNNIPSLREYIINFPIADTSLFFNIYLIAQNIIGKA